MSISKIIISGFGGQGVMLLGQLIAYSAMIENKRVTWLPAYGPEMRGGTANCSIIVSDKEISSPVISSATELVVFNYPSLLKFQSVLAPGGKLYLNKSMISESTNRNDVQIFEVNTNDIAISLGNEKVANLVMLGALIGTTKIVKKESIKEALAKVFKDNKAKLIPINFQAYEEGEKLFK
jgi:2-oxoglutarate ferredoxin oxidoreductase subunit gamma